MRKNPGRVHTATYNRDYYTRGNLVGRPRVTAYRRNLKPASAAALHAQAARAQAFHATAIRAAMLSRKALEGEIIQSAAHAPRHANVIVVDRMAFVDGSLQGNVRPSALHYDQRISQQFSDSASA